MELYVKSSTTQALLKCDGKYFTPQTTRSVYMNMKTASLLTVNTYQC